MSKKLQKNYLFLIDNYFRINWSYDCGQQILHCINLSADVIYALKKHFSIFSLTY